MTTTCRALLVEAFSAGPLGGNGAAVVLLVPAVACASLPSAEPHEQVVWIAEAICRQLCSLLTLHISLQLGLQLQQVCHR